MKVYLTAAFPNLRHEVDEILQDFCQDRILQEGWLVKADPARGKFRHFLKTSLRNYVKDLLRSRAGQPVSLEEMEVEPAAQELAESAFDLEWARLVLGEVLQRMEQDCKRPGKDQPGRSRIWEIFRFRLLAPTMDDVAPMPYEELVERTGIVSPIEAQNLLATAKRIFARHLQGVIADYARESGAAKVELEDLRNLLGRAALRTRN